MLLGGLCLGALSFGAVGAGCAHDTPVYVAGPLPPAPPPPPAPRSPPAHHAVDHRDWTKLGERWVDGTRDRDVITVDENKGPYRRVMIVVENSALEMFDVDITFADGEVFSPHTRHVFEAETRSHTIDLPGTRRSIRKVAFRYGNLPGGGRAQAELWAQ
jgi:hypothetical protein